MLSALEHSKVRSVCVTQTRSGKFIYENMLSSNKLAATLNMKDIIWPNYPAEYYIPILLYVQYNTRILTKHFFGHKTSVVTC